MKKKKKKNSNKPHQESSCGKCTEIKESCTHYRILGKNKPSPNSSDKKMPNTISKAVEKKDSSNSSNNKKK